MPNYLLRYRLIMQENAQLIAVAADTADDAFKRAIDHISKNKAATLKSIEYVEEIPYLS